MCVFPKGRERDFSPTRAVEQSGRERLFHCLSYNLIELSVPKPGETAVFCAQTCLNKVVPTPKAREVEKQALNPGKIFE